MKLLLICHRFPWPVHRGDTLTVFKMAQFFGARHELDLLCHAPERPQDLSRVQPMVRELTAVPFSRARACGRLLRAATSPLPFQVAWCTSGNLRARAARLLAARTYDAAIVYYLRPAPCLDGVNGPVKIAALQLSLATEWARAADHARSPWGRFLRRIEARRLARYETALFERFDKCLLISPHDRDRIADHDPDKVWFNPHGVDTVKYAPRPHVPVTPHRVIFTGRMAFHPNADAADYFAREIFPIVRGEIPDAQFLIVGRDPLPAVRRLATLPGVTVTGTVPDIEDHLAAAAVAVDPLRVGAGLQNKVLEAMSMARPVVMTTVANEGIGATDGQHALVRDDPRAFAAAVIELLRDPARGETLASNARRWICERWTWEYHFERLEAMLEALVARKQGDRRQSAIE